MDVELKHLPVPPVGGNLVEIGVVSRYFSRLGVVAVKIESDRTVRLNDALQFGEDGEKHFRVWNISMQRNRWPIDSTTGPDHVGIETGCRANPGTKVFMVTDLIEAA